MLKSSLRSRKDLSFMFKKVQVKPKVAFKKMNSHNLSMMVSPARRIQKLISGNTTLFPTPKHKIRSVARARKTQQKRKATESRLKRVAEIQDSLKRRNEIQQGKE